MKPAAAFDPRLPFEVTLRGPQDVLVEWDCGLLSDEADAVITVLDDAELDLTEPERASILDTYQDLIIAGFDRLGLPLAGALATLLLVAGGLPW